VATKNGITVTGVEVHDFRRIKLGLAKLVPQVGLVRITGKNGAGKTSFLSAIRAALGGAGEVHEASLREGAEEDAGEVALTLSNDFTVRRRLTEANPKGYLTVVGPDGGKHAQSKLDEWLGATSFDPLAYFSLRPDRQREILLSLGVDPELPKKLDEVRAERKRVYAERTPWISQRQRASRTPKPEGERPEPVDVSGEMARLRELQASERERGDAFRTATDRIAQGEAIVRDADDTIAELEQRLARVREHKAEGEKYLAEGRKKLKAAEQLPDPSDEMEAVKARIEAADAVHESLTPWREYERAQKEAAEAKEHEEKLTAEIGSLDQRERALICDAGIPVEGLTFAEDGSPLLNERPLELASGAERCRLAVAVAMAVNPDLRVCLLDEEANGLDLESLDALDELAKANDFQVWAVRLGLEGPGEVLVVDGEAWDRDRVEEPEEVTVDA